MSIYRRAAKRDANEGPIVRALEAVGATVLRLSGADVPDLAVYCRGQWFLIEVKIPKGRLRPGQHWDETISPGAVIVARTEEDALRAIGF